MLKKSVTSLLLAICLISVSFYTPANAAAKKVTKKALSGTTWKNKVSDPTNFQASILSNSSRMEKSN